MEKYTRKNLDFVLKHYRKGVLDTSKAIMNFNARTAAGKAAGHVLEHSGNVRSQRIMRVWITAVSSAAAIAAGVFIFMNTGNRAWTEFATADAVEKYMLPDSTELTLAPDTHIRYRKAFRRHRQVEMDGKVFFQVTKDAAHPFEVSAGDAYVKVLGTEFQIDNTVLKETSSENNPDISVQRGTEVSVRSGRVFFSKTPESKGLVLTQDMAASLDRGEEIPVLINHAPNPEVWATGVFEYENTPLSEVLDELSDYYGVELYQAADGSSGYGTETGRAYPEKCLTGTFGAEDLDQIIGLIEEALGVEIRYGRR